MAYTFKKNLVSSSKYSIKCPFAMDAEYITIHNTANDATAENEIAYMNRNNNQVSYHVAIDDKHAIQGLPYNRNGWHCGDGRNGTGNRKSIGIEICYSRSGGPKYVQAEENAVHFTAQLLHERGWGIDRVKKHQDWSGKYCPHRILDGGRWNQFKDRVQNALDALGGKKPSKNVTKPSSNSESKVYSIVDWMNNNGVDSSFSNRKKLATKYGISNYSGTAAQNTKLLELLREGLDKKPETKPKVNTTPKGDLKTGSIVTYLNSIGVSSSYSNRKKLAAQHGISGYTGTAAQNTKLLGLIRGGAKPKAPATTAKPKGNMTTGSIVTYLNSIGVNSSYSNRKKLASQYGIKNYTGTAAQNTSLLSKMRGSGGKVSTPKPKGNMTTGSIVTYLNSIGVNSSYSNRTKLAAQYGIKNYKGTAAQNTQLLRKMRGK